MITRSPEEFLENFRRIEAAERAVMRAALLVTPHGFRPSAETAQDNRYVRVGEPVDTERAHAQHAAVVRKLTELGVPCVVFSGLEGLEDAVYVNNAFATVPGRLIAGAMRHPGRRKEAAREDIRGFFQDLLRYEVVDLSKRECVAELTGPLVIDRRRRVGFLGMSERVDAAGARAMHEAFALRLTFQFDLVPEEYHTNLVLAVLAGRAAILHEGSFVDPAVPDAIEEAYPGRTLRLTDEEKTAFAGNSIAVTERDVLFSATSLRALRPEARRALEDWGFRAHGVEIDELEKGGGSLRCLIGEIF